MIGLVLLAIAVIVSLEIAGVGAAVVSAAHDATDRLFTLS